MSDELKEEAGIVESMEEVSAVEEAGVLKSKQEAVNVELAPKNYSSYAKVNKRVHTEKPASPRAAAPKVDDGNFPSEKEVRESFAVFAAKKKTTDLDKDAFKELIKQLSKKAKGKTPSVADLEAAFVMADEDKGGTVDVEEFLHLFEAIKAGEVSGLSAGLRSGPSQKKTAEAKQKKFRQNLKVKREEKSTIAQQAKKEWEKRDHQTKTDDIGHLGTATASSANHKDAHTSEKEIAEYRRKNERELMGRELTKAKDEWESRDKATVADDIGHLATGTSASAHHHDNPDADHTPEGEFIAYMRKNERKLLSTNLTEAKSEWEKRRLKHEKKEMRMFEKIDADGSGELDLEEIQGACELLKLTVEEATELFYLIDADNSGSVDAKEFLAHYKSFTQAKAFEHAGNETESSKLHENAEVVGGEAIAYMRKNERRLMGEELTQAKSEWESRDKATVAEDIGHLGEGTAAQANNYGKQDADHTPEGEFIAYMRKHQRDIMGKELTQAKNDWEGRRLAHEKKEMKMFERIDVDGSGELDLEEIQGACELLKLTVEEATELFYLIDTDHGGTVDSKEFLAHYKNFTKAKAFEHAANETESSLMGKDHKGRFRTKVELDLKAAKEDRSAMSDELSDAKSKWLKRQTKSKKSYTEAADVRGLSKLTEAQAHHHDKVTSDNSSAKELDQYNRTHGREQHSAVLSRARGEWEKRRGGSRSRGKSQPKGGGGGEDFEEGQQSEIQQVELSRNRGGEGLRAGLESSGKLSALEKWRTRQQQKQEITEKQDAANELLVNLKKNSPPTTPLAGVKARLGRRFGRSPNPAPAAPVGDAAAGDDASGDAAAAAAAAAAAKGPLSFVPDKFSFWRKGERGAATSADEAVPPTSPAAAGSFETACAGQTVERSPSYLSPRSAYQKSKEEGGTGSRDNANAPPFPDLAPAATAGEEEAPPSPPAMVEEAPPEEEAITKVQNEVPAAVVDPPVALPKQATKPRVVNSAVEASRNKVAAIREARMQREQAAALAAANQYSNVGTSI